MDIRNSFKEDETVYSVLNIANIHAGDTVTWTYSGPNTVTAMSSLEFTEAGNYDAYSTLNLTEYPDPYGEWIISIDINGT